MIALRGKIERKEDLWRWTGQWAFGAQLSEENQSKALPFEYSWQKAVPASSVQVPSAAIEEANTDNENEAKDEKKEVSDKKEEENFESAQPADANKEATSGTSKEATNEQTKSEKAEAETKDASAKPAEAPKKSQSVSKEEEAVAGTEKKEDSKEKAEEGGKEESRNETSGDTAVVAKKPVTFADDNFKDASASHSDKCPASGEWKGQFDTLGPRKGTKSHIKEQFYLFLNATPPDDARIQFADDDQPADQESFKVPAGHIHVRGTGENQYGTFELLGSLDLETSVLQLQRMYIRTTSKSPRSRGRNKTTLPSSESRAYFTRKKLPSWKRRAAMDDDDGGTKRRRSSEGRPRKKARVDPSASAAIGPTLSISIPPITIPQVSTKRPSPGTVATVPRKRPLSGTGRSATTSSSGHMKLPAAGDPRMARWRAAHFLYYQRSEPITDESGNTSASTTPKYVVYEGEMLNSQREGRGVCLFSNGMLYEGEWHRNKEHGQGTLMSADRKRVIYKGEWERGRMHGRGTYYYSDRRKGKKSEAVSRYEGEFKESMRHGDGTYWMEDGCSYSGQFREGVMSGRGVFTWPDGSVYDGEWKDGKRHGQGLLKASDGFVYDGTWVRNAMEGRGSATYPNGQQYNGLFSRGRREGRGTMLFTNGAVYEGRFRDDAVDGQGTMKMSRAMVVPRERSGGEDDQGDTKEDFMIPVSFQSDMGHIHRKAGFTIGGK